MADTTAPRLGIMTAPSQVGYQDVLRVWREADTLPQIEQVARRVVDELIITSA